MSQKNAKLLFTPLEKIHPVRKRSSLTGLTATILALSAVFAVLTSAQNIAKNIEEPVIIDGDTVEYSADAREITARGNVSISFRDTRLRADEIVVNNQTKEAVATGNVRLQDPRGILDAEKLIYNFETKTGDILVARLRSTPYYYFGNEIQKSGEDRYTVKDGYFSSCNYNQPHFRVKSKRVKVFPGDKIISYSNTIYWKKFPFFYVPRFTRSLKDRFMKIQVKPGKSSDSGPYLLTSWRTDLNDNARLRLYLDWRSDLGLSEGFGLNYDTKEVGKGDFKFYYTQERPDDQEHEFQRYMVRFRHMWDLQPNTKLTTEYYRIQDDRRAYDADADFLKDYFYREYESDMQPKSYALLSHVWPSSYISLFVQKRTNRWYDQMTERLPEITYDLPSIRLNGSPLYFKNQTKFSNLTVRYPTPADLDDDVVRFDTYNQLTLPAQLGFLRLSPYAGIRETLYSKDNQGSSISPRAAFYSGIDLSTKFYRIFDVVSDFLGMSINSLRHIITPVIKYAYIRQPTVSRSLLQEFDDIDTIAGDNRFTFELENKLQTKREGQVADLAMFRVTTDYMMYSKEDGISKGKSRFADFLLDLELMPYAWLRMEADATYGHHQGYFKTANFDSWVKLGEGRSFGLGHRYDRNGGKEMTGQFTWRFNPKWSTRIYQRYEFASSRGKGMKEQEYSITRDLHCAVMSVGFNIKKMDDGRRDETFWVEFDLKIFKESEFDYVQSYHPPKVSN